MSVSLNDVITHLGPSYETLEVSTIAFRQGDKYINVATCIRFSENKYNEPANTDDKTSSGKLFAIKTIMPFQSGWAELKQMFEKSQLTLNGTNIDIDPKIKPMNIFATDKPTFFGCVSFLEPEEWHCVTFTASPTSFERELNDIDRACKELGFADLNACMKSELGLNYAPGKFPFVHIISPIYSKIDSIKISKEGITSVEVTCHKNIQPSIVLNAQFLRNVEKHIQSERLSIPKNSELFEKHTLKLKPVNLNEPDASFRLSLIHKGIGETIIDERKGLNKLIVESGIIVPPLFSAISKFIEEKELLKILAEPDKSKVCGKKLGSADAFEDSVCKLLSMGGLHTIWLVGYDKLRPLESKRELLGAPDIISYDAKSATLFIISCKTTMPGKNEIDSSVNASKIIREHIKDERVTVLPTIFTSTEAGAQATDAKKHGVMIIGPSRMKELVELAQTGRITIENIKNSPSALQP